MADPLKKMVPGDRLRGGEGPFNAAFHNLAIDTIKHVQQSMSPALRRGTSPRAEPLDIEVWILNISEQDLDQNDIVGLGELAWPPGTAEQTVIFRNETNLFSAAPAVNENFGVLLEPIPKGPRYFALASTSSTPPSEFWLSAGDAAAWDSGTAYVAGDRVTVAGASYGCILANTNQTPPNATYWLVLTDQGAHDDGTTYAAGDLIVVPYLGRVTLDGVAKCRIQVINADHRYAAPIEGDYAKLGSQIAAGPAQILKKEAGTGVKWAWIRLCCTETNTSGDAVATELWCNCTVAGGVLTIEDQENVSAVIRLAAGLYQIIFAVTFADREHFEWSGSCENVSAFLYATDRTTDSVTVQTSHLQDVERFGIDARGHLASGAASGSSSGSVGSGESSGPPVLVDCCPDPVAADLSLTLSSTCACMNGVVHLVYGADGGAWWSAVLSCGANTIRLRFACGGLGWQLAYDCNFGAPESSFASSVVCDPFAVSGTLNVSAESVCCSPGDSVTWSVANYF